MILIYFPNGTIHYTISGFGVVTTDEVTGNLLVDGNDTTTCAADISWKYINEQVLEQNDTGYIRTASYYDEVLPTPSLQDQIDAILELI